MKGLYAILLIIFLLPATNSVAQKNVTYKDSKDLPSFEISLANGGTFATDSIPAGQPIIMIFFSTDCSKCRMFVRELQSNYGPLKDTHIYMATPMTMDGAVIFAHDLGLDYFKNITWGVDQNNFVKPYYDIATLPAAVVYNSNRQFVQRFTGQFTAADVLQAVEKAR